jgi:outer membrane lipoprotein-sorting protein
MKGAKQILLAGFAALCMVLPACHSLDTPFIEDAEAPSLVVSSEPLNTVSYTAEYTQDGALPFTCEIKLGSDGRIRRDYVWKDEKGAEKKAVIVSDGKKTVRIEDGKSSTLEDADAAKTRFLAGLILTPGKVIAGALRKKDTVVFPAFDGKTCHAYVLELADAPEIKFCIAATDPETNRWIGLVVRMAGDPDTRFSTNFQEYRTESGVTYPFRIVTSTENGAPVTCVIRDVKINPELPDELFRLPENNG